MEIRRRQNMRVSQWTSGKKGEQEEEETWWVRNEQNEGGAEKREAGTG